MTARRAEQPHTDLADDGALPSAEADDKDLTLAFQRGDDGSYQAIYDRCHDRVMGVCCRMLADKDDAEEAAQETFLRVYQGLARFNGRYELRAWATRIATNVCLDHLRSRARRPADATPVEVLDLEPSGALEGSDPESLLIRNQEGRRVRRLLWSLPPTHRAAIVLRDFEGLSYCDIAVALDLTEAQVKALIHRARRGFRRSWVDGAALLLFPWRQLQRAVNKAKGIESSAEHTVQAAASNVSLVQSCSNLMHSCGSFVGERVATIITAAVVGSAVAGAGVVSTTDAIDPIPPGISVQADAPERSVEPATKRVPRDHAGGESAPASSRVPGGAPTGTTRAPQPMPTPSPSPTPTPTPTPTPSPSESPKNTGGTTPQTKPTPPPFTATLGFDYGQEIPPSEVKSHTYAADCKKSSVKQRLRTTVSHRDGSYPAFLVLDAGSTMGLELTVWKDDREVYYSGGGPLVKSSKSENSIRLEFNGSYGTGGDARSAGLPTSGRFRASLTLDCAASSVVTESIVFSTD